MRWDTLRADAEGAQGALFGLDQVVERTFDTPEFRGMTFYEIRARSILNRIPAASRMPFEWTINPYRGCSHACVYCLDGDTPILMADGRQKPLRDVRVGDEIYGTVREGNYRRYTLTTVLNHWSTVKEAHEVTLEDGTALVASADHRFLTERGWKHVSGAMAGARRRPYLTTNNELLGTGRFAPPPKFSSAYQQGYLCGMVRGDAHLGVYSYVGDERTRTVHRFRLALADRDALDRSQAYLETAGVPTRRFEFSAGTEVRRPMTAIRTCRREAIATVRKLIEWPPDPDEEWSRGFLAGIFDAEGSCSRGIWRVSNTDTEIIEAVETNLSRFGFRFVREPSGRANGLCSIRLLGGQPERLRFTHLVDPAIRRRCSLEGEAIKNSAELKVARIRCLGVEMPMYDITTGTGDFIANGVVSHNCFARRTHEYLDLDAGHDFDSKVVVKVNAPELLRKELAAPRWRGEHIAMGTNVDCYQRAEGRYGLMRPILEALRDRRNPFSILTKGTLVLRDLDILTEAARRTKVSVSVSVGSVDETVWRQVEPGTPAPRARLDVCRTLTDAGIGCGVLMAPILPMLTDAPEQLDATVRAIARAGARSVSPIVLHLRPGAREWWFAWLERTRPDLVEPYRTLYGRGSYTSKAYQRHISQQVADLARRYRVGRSG